MSSFTTVLLRSTLASWVSHPCLLVGNVPLCRWACLFTSPRRRAQVVSRLAAQPCLCLPVHMYRGSSGQPRSDWTRSRAGVCLQRKFLRPTETFWVGSYGVRPRNLHFKTCKVSAYHTLINHVLNCIPIFCWSGKHAHIQAYKQYFPISNLVYIQTSKCI